MGYEGGEVASWVRHCQGVTRRSARELAVVGRQRQTERTIDNTPVDKGHLRDNTVAKNVTGPFPEPEGQVYYSGVETDVAYAPHVEHGTGLWGPSASYYEIRPKDPDGFLRFNPYVRGPRGEVRVGKDGSPLKGGAVYTKFVLHPGSPGQHMFALGAAMTEHEFPEFSTPVLQRWAAECERFVSRA